MDSQEKHGKQAQYYLNRVDMLKKFKPYRKQLERIALYGIESDEDSRLAKIACSIIASDYFYEDSMLDDKSGDYIPLINPPID